MPIQHDEESSYTSSIRIVWWLLGLFAAGAMGGGSLWISSVSGQISELQHELKEMRVAVDGRWKEMQSENTAAMIQRGDRMSALEIKNAMLDLRVGELEKKMDRIIDPPLLNQRKTTKD